MRVIEETNLGLYVWEMPDGKWIGDDEGNYMLIESVKGDAQKIMLLRDTAYDFLRNMGLEPQGRPRFLAGRRKVSDDEYEEMLMRQRAGLVPDKYDVAAIKEEYEFARKNKN